MLNVPTAPAAVPVPVPTSSSSRITEIHIGCPNEFDGKAETAQAWLDSVCYVFFSPCSSDPFIAPIWHPQVSHLVLAPSPLQPHPSLSPPSPTLLNTKPHRSMDLPWIFPDLLFFPQTPISRSFPSFPSLDSPLSLHPCFLITMCSLILLLSLIPCTTIDFPFTLTHLHFVIDLLSYSSNSTMTHSPWLIASSPSYINP